MEIVSFRRVFELDRRAYQIDPNDPRTRLPFVDGVPLRGAVYALVLAVTLLPLSIVPPFSWPVEYFGAFFAPGHVGIGSWAVRLVILIALSMWAYRARFDGRQAHRWIWHWIMYMLHAPVTSAGRPFNLDGGMHACTGSVKIQWDESKSTLPRGRIRGPAHVMFNSPVGLPPSFWRSRSSVARPGGQRTGSHTIREDERLELRP